MLHKQIIQELNEPSFGLNYKHIYPQHLSLDDKYENIKKIYKDSNYKEYIKKLKLFAEFKLSKKQYENWEGYILNFLENLEELDKKINNYFNVK